MVFNPEEARQHEQSDELYAGDDVKGVSVSVVGGQETVHMRNEASDSGQHGLSVQVAVGAHLVRVALKGVVALVFFFVQRPRGGDIVVLVFHGREQPIEHTKIHEVRLT